MKSEAVTESRVQRIGVRALRTIERVLFFIIGAMLFAAAFALLFRALLVLFRLFVAPASDVIDASAAFLDAVLLVLMIVELAYTVVLSLRGVVLSAEPFLIVGLIAVIRRILVITVGEVKAHGAPLTSGASATSIELAILTGVVVAFVVSIALLRTRSKTALGGEGERDINPA